MPWARNAGRWMIGAGRYVGIVGVGHGADGATYFRIHPQPYGASVGWVRADQLQCKGNLANNLKPKKK
jgi:hypothetical protein